jgi:thiol-disulfide isomerase/thioredoxin
LNEISFIGYFFISFYCLILIRVAFIYWNANQLKGNPIAKTDSEIDKLIKKYKKVVLYFYSSYCPQCVGMGEAVDGLSKTHDNIFKMDISENLTIAKVLNIRATPTLLVIENKQIKNVYLGARTGFFIKDILNN